ncbi:IclR family transcriptional regulator [Paeniglutamicibacter psychrophenolicus]|uniref:IclR family transcriptional regulator n=1 Tax=Paeniglutamicibacter psychrophenolicus TaxID=257454 RepID=UPI002782589F|nr:IclR family transcriptional regulator [Paeniglutamicibacter psychrophenolicus]MDQ0092255.1 DNA-binding IclR family transcriptional regulator [Paeniglutamicibacter psychrophenolicus]
MKPAANIIQLVTKATQVVDEISNLGPSTSAELAKAVNEPRPSVYRIVSALEQSGLVRRSDDGRVELGTQILHLGEAAADAIIDRELLATELSSIQRQLGLTASFWIPRNDTAVCLEQVDATDVDLYELSSGRILPLHAGAASHVLLAFQPAEVLESVLGAAPYERLSSKTPTDAVTLRSHIEETRHQGWRLEVNEVVDGIAAISFPVLNPDGTIFGSLTAAGLVDQVLDQQEEAKSVIAKAAQTLTKAMRDFVPKPAERVLSTSINNISSIIAKANALMEALANERISTSARLTEILDEPVSSVYRMLATLAEAGWVEQLGPRGAFRIGSKLISLSGKLLNDLDLRRAAVPVLRSIHEATGETAFMCIRRNTRAVCIERVDGKRVNSRLLSLGGSLPLHTGAAPRALLAFEDRQTWDDYATVVSQTADIQFDARARTKFYADLEAIRSAGYSVSDDDLTPGIAAIGAPVFDHKGHVVASLSVSGLRAGILTEAVDGRTVIELARDGARRLSEYLGAPIPAHS